jgi:uncharacterized protein DUF3592
MAPSAFPQPAGEKRLSLSSNLFIIGFGLVVMVICSLSYAEQRPYPDGTSTTGVVTEVELQRDYRGKLRYLRLVSFTTQDHVTATVGDYHPADLVRRHVAFTRPTVGDVLTVSYRPDDLESARIVDKYDWETLFLVGVGALISGIGLVLLVIRMWRRAHS